MRRLMIGLAVAAMTCGALSGCFREPDILHVDDTIPSVFSVLMAGADSAVVLVVRPAEASGPGRVIGHEGVGGAEVRISSGGDTTWAAEMTDQCTAAFVGNQAPGGCYRATFTEPVEPGQEYHLEILLPDGGRITGQTTVPQPPRILEPAAGETVVASCDSPDSCYGQRPTYPDQEFVPVAWVPMVWELPPGVRRVIPTLEETTTFHDGQTYTGGCELGRIFARFGAQAEPGAAADSLPWPVLNIQCLEEALQPGRFDSIRARMSVYALGPTYTAYLNALAGGNTVREARASHGLSGAYGVFGATTPAHRTLMIVRDQ